MRIGSGIAVLGVWGWVGACALSPQIGNPAYGGSVLIAFAITAILFVRDLVGNRH